MYDISFIKILQDYLKSNFHRAKVISTNDSLNLNRIQINIFGMTDDIPDESLPWCELQFQSGLITYPIVNDIIWIFFENNDYLRPHYVGTIYSGLTIDNEPGYKKYSDNLGSQKESYSRNNMGYNFEEIKNIDDYRSTLRIVNKIEKDEDLVLKNTVSHFDSITAESTWTRTFEGLNVEVDADISGSSSTTVSSLSEDYDKSPFNRNQKIYPWYELREAENNTDPNKIYGGWRFLTEADINKGLGIFPDSTRRIYLKRYKNWVKNRISNYTGIEGLMDALIFENCVPKSWNFIPTPPNIYWDPELAKATFYEQLKENDTQDSKGTVAKIQSLDYQSIQTFPFGKMKIKNREFYKQFSWNSYDGKSLIELDDNNNYERLALIFNYGNGGLEFSRAGLNGVELWTDGAFKIRGMGITGDGKGNTRRITNVIEGLGSDIRIISDRQAVIIGQSGSYLGGMGPVTVRSKLNGVSIVGANGISLGSMDGYKAGKGVFYKGNVGVSSGVPVISGSGEASSSSLQGWFPFASGTKAEATDYYKALNFVLVSIKNLCKKLIVANLPTPPALTPQSIAIFNWASSTSPLIEKISDNALSTVHLIGAWEGIQLEAGGRKT